MKVQIKHKVKLINGTETNIISLEEPRVKDLMSAHKKNTEIEKTNFLLMQSSQIPLDEIEDLRLSDYETLNEAFSMIIKGKNIDPKK